MASAELVEVELTPGVTVERQLTVQPKTFVELCAQLKTGQIVQWRFRSAAATDFNIHYHIGNEVKYPERHEGVSNASGRLEVELDQGYCWMWTNQSSAQTAVTVTLERAN